MDYTGGQTSIWASRFLFPVAVWPWVSATLTCQTGIITLSLQTLTHHWQWGMALLWVADNSLMTAQNLLNTLSTFTITIHSLSFIHSFIHLPSASKGINPASQVRSPKFPASLAAMTQTVVKALTLPLLDSSNTKRESSMKCTIEWSSQCGEQLKCEFTRNSSGREKS